MKKLPKFLSASQLNEIFNIIIKSDNDDLKLGISLDDIEVRYITDFHVFDDTDITEFYLIVCHKSQSYFIGYDETLEEWDCFSFIPLYSGHKICDYLNNK